jgi:hypothetical protein
LDLLCVRHGIQCSSPVCAPSIHEAMVCLAHVRAYRYRATEPFPTLDERSADSASLLYSNSTLKDSTQTSHSTLSSPAQNSNRWTMGSATHGSYASQRHTMMFLDSRPPRGDAPVSRPLSMTAVPGFRNLGFQNPQGEYLPQPHMPPPIVQPPKLIQATVVHSKFSSPKNHLPLLHAKLSI